MRTSQKSRNNVLRYSVAVSWAIFCLASIGCTGAPTSGEDSETLELRYWLENMVWHHRYDVEEVASALGCDVTKAQRYLEEHDVLPENRPEFIDDLGLRILPYPGGRHPRIGFLEGAIDPHRDTKFSVFLPGKDAGYVVVDLPEAIWWNPASGRELLYLAHTHIPTYRDKRKIVLESFDWTREGDPAGREGGVIRSTRKLPNGVEFAATARVVGERVEMTLELKNGSKERISGLRTQICVMLKGAPAFNAQIAENKTVQEATAAVRSADGERAIVTEWELAKAWQNPPVPCIHSDPVFPDLEPGESRTLTGFLHLVDQRGESR